MARVQNKEDLIALRDGSQQAFDSIFKAYYNNIKYFVRDLVKSESDAEEISQDVFIKLWEVRSTIDCEKNFRAFLFKIAYNMALKQIKKKNEKDSLFSELTFQDEVGECTDDQYTTQELILKIEMAVEELSARKKEVYLMNINDGLEAEEIAEKLNIDVRTVTNTLRLAIKEVKSKASELFCIIFLLS